MRGQVLILGDHAVRFLFKPGIFNQVPVIRNLNLAVATKLATERIRIACIDGHGQIDMAFPVEVFPLPLQRYVERCSATFGCPKDFFAVPLLVISAAAIGGSRALRVKSSWDLTGGLPLPGMGGGLPF